MPNFGKKVGSRGLQRCQDMVFRIFWMAEELPNTSQGPDLKAKPKSGRMMQRHLKFAVGAGDFEGAGAKLGLQARWLEENAEVVAPLTSPTPSTALWTCSYAFVGCGCRRIRGPLPASATAGRAPTRPKSTANFHSERMTSLKSARWKNSWRRGAATDCHGKTCWIRCDITSVSGKLEGISTAAQRKPWRRWRSPSTMLCRTTSLVRIRFSSVDSMSIYFGRIRFQNQDESG